MSDNTKCKNLNFEFSIIHDSGAVKWHIVFFIKRYFENRVTKKLQIEAIKELTAALLLSKYGLCHL